MGSSYNPPSGGSGAVVNNASVLYSGQTQVFTSGLIKETLDSYLMPADTLDADGKGLRITATFIKSPSANAVDVGIDIGGVNLVTYNTGTPNSVIKVTLDVWRDGADSQKMSYQVEESNGAYAGGIAVGALVDGLDQLIEAFGTTPAINTDVSLWAWRVELLDGE